ncbi:hypothetical protein QC763_0001070 [Podospora pseudopauciseta]|uniref:Uncharacterized protein n=1 Tax=Podospora pseudopauciseta TaxID=2093780 RepID=A0ABR0HVS1_9PEZI|nr:hypothetical protein QC763_0001070 [Podospora pseudopauciseta]
MQHAQPTISLPSVPVRAHLRYCPSIRIAEAISSGGTELQLPLPKKFLAQPKQRHIGSRLCHLTDTSRSTKKLSNHSVGT